MQNILPRRRLRPRRCIWSPTPEVHNRKWMSTVALQALDQLTAGVIIADGRAEVIEMNRAAESIVQLEDGLLIRNDRLCARRAFETGKVTKLIAGATVEGRSAASAGRMLIGRCDGLPAYVLSVAPLRTGLAVDNRRLAMVVIVDPALHCPIGEGPRGVLWIVTSGGAACGGASDRGNGVSDRRQYRRSDHHSAYPARLRPEKSRRAAAVGSDPHTVEHWNRVSVPGSRVVRHSGDRRSTATVARCHIADI
jgi:hypothetical protein